MDFAEYQSLAVKTVSPVTDEMKERMGKAMVRLMDRMHSAALIGQALDPLKKHIFYGAPDPEAISAPPMPAGTTVIHEDDMVDLLHGLMGLLTEYSELYDSICTPASLDDIDWVNVLEEIGDKLWYLGLIAAVVQRHIGKGFDDAARRNIQKLLKRYPKKFNSTSALVRNLLAERDALEGIEDASSEAIPIPAPEPSIAQKFKGQ